jgi:hypothetical protein
MHRMRMPWLVRSPPYLSSQLLVTISLARWAVAGGKPENTGWMMDAVTYFRL